MAVLLITGCPGSAMTISPSFLSVVSSWREANGYNGRGFVVLYGGSVSSWCAELPQASHWILGCIAVDPQGRSYLSCGLSSLHSDSASFWHEIDHHGNLIDGGALHE